MNPIWKSLEVVRSGISAVFSWRLQNSIVALMIALCGTALAQIDEDAEFLSPSALPSLPSDPTIAYFEIKRIVNAMYEDEDRRRLVDGRGYPPMVGFLGGDPGLAPCTGQYMHSGLPYESLGTELESVASLVVFARRTLLFHGFPRSIWGDDLVRYEELLLHDAVKKAELGELPFDISTAREQQELLNDLVWSLNRYRELGAPTLPEAYIGGECGDGEVFVSVETRPAGAQVWFISEFFHKLCTARGIDPWDMSRCKGWFEETGKGVAWLSGVYRYTARWPDGEWTRSLAPFSGPLFSHDPEKGDTVLIAQHPGTGH